MKAPIAIAASGVAAVTAVLGLASLSAGPAIGSARAPVVRCPSHPTSTLLRTSTVRVLIDDGHIVSCYGLRGPAHRLETYYSPSAGDLESPDKISHVRAAGRFVAYEHATQGRQSAWVIRVYDATTGRERTDISTSSDPADGSGTDYGPSTQIKLSPTGAVAWTATANDPSLATAPRLAATATSSTTVTKLAEGPMLSRTYLTIDTHGRTCWKNPSLTCGPT